MKKNHAYTYIAAILVCVFAAGTILHKKNEQKQHKEKESEASL